MSAEADIEVEIVNRRGQVITPSRSALSLNRRDVQVPADRLAIREIPGKVSRSGWGQTPTGHANGALPTRPWREKVIFLGPGR